MDLELLMDYFSVISEVYLCEIPDGACDCDGNVFDECGVCNGPGAVYECGCSDINLENVTVMEIF